MSSPQDADPKAILVIRLSAIGDNVMATPLISALRRRYPDTRLVWLTQPESAELVAHHPDLDQVIVWPRRRFGKLARGFEWRSLARESCAVLKALRRQRFDWTIDTQGLLKSGLLALATGARRRIGLGAREGAQWLVHANVPKRHGDPRLSSEYEDLADFLGLPTDRFEMRLELSPAARAGARDVVAEFGLESGFVVLCPFTTRPQKHWFDEHWAAFIDGWTERSDLPLVLLGGPMDAERARSILAAARRGDRAINLAGPRFLKIPDAAALIELSSALVGVDTGMTHMALAFKRPTVALFGSTVPYTDTRGAPARILFEPLICAPCRKRPTCGGAWTCMRLLDPQRVLAACSELLTQPA